MSDTTVDAAFDDTSLDPHATPEQIVFLERAIILLDRAGENELTAEERIEWHLIARGLRDATPNLYGCEWIHRNWHLTLHGSKVFAERWTREYAAEKQEFFNNLLAGSFRNEPAIPTRQLPEAPTNFL